MEPRENDTPIPPQPVPKKRKGCLICLLTIVVLLVALAALVLDKAPLRIIADAAVKRAVGGAL